MVLKLRKLSRYETRYRDMKRDFKENWLHTNKKAKVKEIFFIDERATEREGGRMGQLMTLFHSWRLHDSEVKCRYHGTSRRCLAGEDPISMEPCRDRDCHLCGILRSGFSIYHTSPNAMFGQGIYSTTVSSKADSYAMNNHLRSEKHVMLLCNIIADNPQYVRRACTWRIEPDRGHDCVEAVTCRNGGSVVFPETVVYNEERIIPVGLIVYTRKGWTP